MSFGDGCGGGGGAPQPQIQTPFLLQAQQWLNELVEYEVAHSRPAPLTKEQKKLLAQLEQILGPPTSAEPAIGDTNWVGVLLEYRAKNQIPGDSTIGAEFVEVSGVVPGRSLAPSAQPWRITVRIDEHAEPFPNASCGLRADGSVPSFARKQDAKKYAAKCAVEWLRESGHMPEVGVKFPTVATPRRAPSAAASSPSAASPSPARLKTPTTTVSSGGAATQRVNSEMGRGNSVYGTDEPSAGYVVSQLCNDLNIQPPQYRITQDPEHKDIFSGYPEFDPLDLGSSKLPHLPDGTGHVSNVYSRKLAKQKIAEALVPHLERALEVRRERVGKWMEEEKARKATLEREN